MFMRFLNLVAFGKFYKTCALWKNMEVVFLGTGDMKPTAMRNHTAILLNHNSESILIDCGEGTQRQFRFAKENPCRLTRILITHWHGDHVLGIPGLLQTLAQNNYSKTLYIYGPVGTKKFIAEILRIFEFAGSIRMEVKEINSDGKVEETKDLIIEAFKLSHGCNCFGYSVREKDRVKIDKNKLKKLKIPNSPLIGQLQSGKDIMFNGRKIKADSVTYMQKGKKIAVIMDTIPCDGCYNAAKNSDVLVTEATFLNELKDKAHEYKHLTASQAAEIAKKSGAKKLFLTHISARYEQDLNQILKEAKKVFKNTLIAKDLMKIEI